MQEILDGLKEAMTALDKEMHDYYYMKHSPDRSRALQMFWLVKKDIWYAQMHVLDAFRGEIPDACI